MPVRLVNTQNLKDDGAVDDPEYNPAISDLFFDGNKYSFGPTEKMVLPGHAEDDVTGEVKVDDSTSTLKDANDAPVRS